MTIMDLVLKHPQKEAVFMAVFFIFTGSVVCKDYLLGKRFKRLGEMNYQSRYIYCDAAL